MSGSGLCVSAGRAGSLSSAASTGRRFQLGIKAHPEGLVSQHLLGNAHVGMVVGLSIPLAASSFPSSGPNTSSW